MKPSFSRTFVASTMLGAIFLASCTPRGDQNTASTPAPIKVIDSIYVPGADDKLHLKKVSFPALDTQLKSGGNPSPALEELIKTSPKWFPKGARVEDVKDNGSTITLLLSPEFDNAKHWSQGETTTELAVYALVNTLAKDGKKVALTIEGKPMTTLGELDVSGALEADPSLNAPAPSATKADTAQSDTTKTEATPDLAQPSATP